jgi:ABC-type nitrate/sulfonate/bicarbonate transport system substrate-binding protein
VPTRNDCHDVKRAHLMLSSVSAAVAGRAAGAVRDTVTTQFSWLPNVEYAGFFVAGARGCFDRERIVHRYRSGGPQLPSVSAVVVAGGADVGVDELDKVVDAVRAGHDLVVLGAIYQRPVGGLLSLPRRPIERASDLVGARIGLQSGGREYIDGILRLNALPLRYTAVAVGGDPEPLVRGAVDAYLCYMTNQPLILEERGIPYVARSLTAYGYFGYDGCLFCRRSVLQARRAVLVRYLRAVQFGWRVNIAEPEFGAAVTVQQAPAALQLHYRQQLRQNQAQAPFMQSDETRRNGLLAVSSAGVRRAYATLRAGGRTNLPDVRRLFDPTLLRDADRTRVA